MPTTADGGQGSSAGKERHLPEGRGTARARQQMAAAESPSSARHSQTHYGPFLPIERLRTQRLLFCPFYCRWICAFRRPETS